MIEFIFFLALFGCAYSYFVYPVLLLIVRPRARISRESSALPRISVIISARNEGRQIGPKLDATLHLDYPTELLEIIVASDCSDDETDEIVKRFEPKGVRLVRLDPRGGKEAAQSLGIAASTGDILVFTDSATRLDQDALLRISRGFHIPAIGAISSTDKIEPAIGQAASGEGSYVRYEMWLRQMESNRAGLVGLSGSLFALRREIALEWPINVPSDITAALRTARMGYVAVADPELHGYYKDIKDGSREYPRKVRTVLRGITALSEERALLNPFRYGFFSIQLWSHKVMRWLTPWFLLILWTTSAVLAINSYPIAMFFYCQTAGYCIAAAIPFFPMLQRLKILRFCHYLVAVHLAMLDAALRFLAGQRITTWNPSAR